MHARIWKWLALAAGGPIVIVLLAIAALMVSDQIAYNKANITDALLRDGRYDPAAHFVFDRACTFSPESGPDSSLLDTREYRDVDLIYLPDTFTHWSLMLIDDRNKTYRILYVVDPLVKSPGNVCNARITLGTEKIDGHVAAYVEEARGR